MKRLLLAITLMSFWACTGSNSGSQSGQGSKQKTFRYNQTGGLSSLDPAFASTRANVWAVTQIYNGLFDFTKNLDPHKALAKEYEISPDGKVYTFTIKDGIYFHDNPCFPNGKGREVKAEDFVRSFKRLLTLGTGKWIFADKVLKASDGVPSDTCFRVVNDHTFKIYLQRRFPAFLHILATPYTYVVPEEAIDKYGDDLGRNPVGTGPFMLKKGYWDEKNKMVLHKNPKYWKNDPKTNTPLPHLDVVEVTFVEDRNTEFNMFYKGDLDLVVNLSEQSREIVLEKTGEVKEKFAGKFKVEKIPYMLTEYIGFKVDDASSPFSKLKVRQALNYAVNRKGLISVLRHGLGVAGEAGFVPIALPSFDSTQVKGYAYNPKKAEELLKEAGFPGGQGLPSLTLYTYTTDKEIAEYLQKDFEKIGVKIKIEMNKFSAHNTMVKEGKAGMYRASWIGDYPDAENFLALYYSKNLTPNGPNTTKFSNPEYDKLFEEAHETDNPFTRFADYHKMDKILMENSPVIVLYYDEILHMKQNYVVGLEADVMNNLMLENVNIKK